MSEDYFLSRWSRRKHAAKRPEPEPPLPPPAEVSAPVPVTDKQATATAPPLPDVETLTPESDFTPFMHEDVDESLRRRALKNLFQDPRFNVMDGLDVYIDDYSKPDPLPEGWLEKMNQVARLVYREPEAKADDPVADENVTADSNGAGTVAVEKAPEELPAEASPESTGSDTSATESAPPPVRES
jgi:hypothetical protein